MKRRIHPILAAVLFCIVAPAGADAPSAPKAGVASAARADIEPGKAKGSISVASFNRLLKEGATSVHLVDASSAREFAAGSIKGATNIPINQLEKRVETLPNDKPIIFFCATGGRASESYDTVKLLRADLEVYFLDAQVMINADGSATVR
jgi:rhodanese-related sulfurtransferase